MSSPSYVENIESELNRMVLWCLGSWNRVDEWDGAKFMALGDPGNPEKLFLFFVAFLSSLSLPSLSLLLESFSRSFFSLGRLTTTLSSLSFFFRRKGAFGLDWIGLDWVGSRS